MFKFLRSQAKLFYWVIAASFILFLILGGLTGRGCQAPGTGSFEPGVIGEVNGVKVSAQFYDDMVRQQIAFMRQQAGNRELNANQYALARQRAWDTVVQSVLVDQAIEDRKIKITDDEVLDAFQNNPPQALLENYRREDGQIDMDRYFADLQNPDNDWSGVEQYVRTLLKRQKLNDQITAGVSVSEQDVREEYIRQTGRGVAEFMGVTFVDLALDYSPSDAEIQEYYASHQDEFLSDEKARCQFVKFAKEASEADYEEIRTLILDIKNEIETGKRNFEQAAMEYSEDGSASTGGDLGTFNRERMVAPFTEAAFSLPVGVISEPVRTQFGYHLIEVLEQINDAETGELAQVHARHILLKVTPSPATLDLISEAAGDFRSRVDGNSFIMTAEAEGLEVVTPVPFAAGQDIPGLPLSLEASNWVFASKAGAVSPVLENDSFFFVVRADGKVPGGPTPLENVRGAISGKLIQQRKVELAREKLNPAVGEVQLGTSLAEAAAKFGLKHAVTDTFTMNSNIPDVGYGSSFNKEVIYGTVDSLLPEIETNRGLFAAVPLWIKPVDEADFQSRRAGIMGFLLDQAKNQALEEWLNEQTAAAEITDLRYRARPSV